MFLFHLLHSYYSSSRVPKVEMPFTEANSSYKTFSLSGQFSHTQPFWTNHSQKIFRCYEGIRSKPEASVNGFLALLRISGERLDEVPHGAGWDEGPHDPLAPLQLEADHLCKRRRSVTK